MSPSVPTHPSAGPGKVEERYPQESIEALDGPADSPVDGANLFMRELPQVGAQKVADNKDVEMLVDAGAGVLDEVTRKTLSPSRMNTKPAKPARTTAAALYSCSGP